MLPRVPFLLLLLVAPLGSAQLIKVHAPIPDAIGPVRGPGIESVDPVDELVRMTSEYVKDFDPNDDLQTQMDEALVFIGKLPTVVPGACFEWYPGADPQLIREDIRAERSIVSVPGAGPGRYSPIELGVYQIKTGRAC